MTKIFHKIIPAAYLIPIKDNKILLLRRANTWYEDWNYSMIAWKVDSGETFTKCIIREWKEEAWITLKPEDLTVAHIMHRNPWLETDNQRIDTYFISEKREWEITNMEPHKCDDLSWFDLNNLPENTIPYIKKVLENINNKIFYSEYWWKD